MNYVSVNSKPDHTPLAKLGKFFLKGPIPDLPGTKKVRNPYPAWGRKIEQTPPPGATIFKTPAKNTKYETEVMKNSTEMLICVEILKQ